MIYIYMIYIYIYIIIYIYISYIYIYRLYRLYNPILHWIFHWIPCGRILRSLPYRSKPERSVRLMQAASLESWKLRIENITCTYIYIYTYIIYFSRRKFRSQTSDNMDRWKAEQRRGREKRKIRREKSQKRKSQKKEDADARKGGKVAKHCVFPMICGSGGSKSRLAKAAGAEPAGQMRDDKLHAVVARSTFRSQNVQSTPCSDHF